MIERKLQATDDFWNIGAQERRTKESYQKQIDQLNRVIALSRKTLTLKHQPGFKEFTESIESLRQVEQSKLVTCFSSNDHMRIIQGKAQALSDILAILRDTEKTVEGLEAQLQAVQNEIAAAVTADGKVIPNPIGVHT